MHAIQTFCEYIKYVPGRELAQNLFVDPATCCIFFRQMHEARIRRCFRSVCQSLEKGGDIVARLRVRYTMVFQPSVDCIEVFEMVANVALTTLSASNSLESSTSITFPSLPNNDAMLRPDGQMIVAPSL
jgi:hypothetical protein